jgi:hypothetical protein
MSLEVEDHAPLRAGDRRRWILLALLPGILADACFIGALFISMAAPTPPSVAALGTGMLYAALFLPLAVPGYLLFLGLRYVRIVHGGFKSAFPFVLMYSAANLVLWAGGAAFVGSQIKWA